jgi:hypothetical protein
VMAPASAMGPCSREPPAPSAIAWPRWPGSAGACRSGSPRTGARAGSTGAPTAGGGPKRARARRPCLLGHVQRHRPLRSRR